MSIYDCGGEGACHPLSPDVVGRADLVNGAHTIVIFDLETTGFHHKRDRVIQLAAKVMGSGDRNGTFSSLIDPDGRYLSYKIRELTGINPQVLAANNARPFREVWPRFTSWLKSVGTDSGGIVLAAHNAAFDHKFLTEEIARAGFSRLALSDVGVVSIVDTLAVLRESALWQRGDADSDLPPRPRRFNLGELFKHLFEDEEMPGAHSALGDVQGLERVLSAPSICERWRLVANASVACQVYMSRGVADPEGAVPASNAAPVAPPKRATPKAPSRTGQDEDMSRTTKLEKSRQRAREWAREQQAKKKK